MALKRMSKEELISRYNELINTQGKRGQAKYYLTQLNKRYNINIDGTPYKTVPIKIETPIKEVENTKEIEINKELVNWSDVITFEKPIRVGIFGLQGSGKSSLCKEIAYEHKNNTFIFDIIGEYEKFNRYKTDSRSYPETAIEFDNFYKQFYLKKVINKKIKSILIIDEASRVCPNKKVLPDGIAELNDLHRHYNTSFILVARRPVQIHTDLLELLNYVICFKLTGVNDVDKLKDINPELEKAVKTLKQYEYVIFDVAQGKLFYGETQG